MVLTQVIVDELLKFEIALGSAGQLKIFIGPNLPKVFQML
jgi:hypothetical protein